MSKFLSFKNLTACLLICLGLQSGFSQTPIFSETFASAAAFAKWTAANTGAGAGNWVRETNASANMGFLAAPPAFAAPTAADGFAFFNSDANGQGNRHDVQLTSQSFSLTGHHMVFCRFHSQFADFVDTAATEPPRNASLRVSTDGGATWTEHALFTTEPSFGFAQQAQVKNDIVNDIAIPEAEDKANVMIQFRWDGLWEYGWKLDDINVYEHVATVTFKVNASQLTVDPTGMKIAGSFNGWADDNMTNAGNGIWTFTTTAPIGQEILWKYKNGPTTWENVTAACGKDDGFGGFNRVLVPAGDVALPAVCFSSCNPCVVPCNQNPNSIICDDFETYITTQKLAQQSSAAAGNKAWTTWDGMVGTAEDGIVTTEQAASGTKSFKILSTATAGGPQDVVLKLQNKSTGNYQLKWKTYIPTGKNGYFNFQNVVPIGAGAWNLEMYFEDNGKGRGNQTQTDLFKFDFPYDKWFTVDMRIDLDNNIFKCYVDGKYAGAMQFPNNLGGIDFYGSNAKNQYYIDDVEYVSLPPVAYNVDICDAAIDLQPYFGGSPGVAQTTGLQDNTTATAQTSDPAWGSGCSLEPTPSVDKSMWYSFIGDGQRYHVETVPCNATNYINGGANDPGDTQMGLYTGPDCSNLTQLDCNEDIDPNGNPDYRAGLDIQTANGTQYWMMIDGYRISPTIVATGEFCNEITLAPAIDCSQAAVGDATGVAYVCNGDATSFTIDAAGTIIPTVGPIYGLSWAISNAPIPAGTYPPDAPGYSAGFLVSNNIATPALANDGSLTFFQPGNLYYFTPTVVGGGTNTTGNPNFLHNVDVTTGCFQTGASIPVFLMPSSADLDPISGLLVQTGNTLDLTPGGGLGGFVGDPTLYTYLWSNGATTEDITITGGGTYSVTINDISGCSDIDPFVISITEATDPQSVKNLAVSPNPANENLVLSLQLDHMATVRAELVNGIGQVQQTLDLGKVDFLNRRLDISQFADGAYFLRLTIDGEKAQRAFVVHH